MSTSVLRNKQLQVLLQTIFIFIIRCHCYRGSIYLVFSHVHEWLLKRLWDVCIVCISYHASSSSRLKTTLFIAIITSDYQYLNEQISERKWPWSERALLSWLAQTTRLSRGAPIAHRIAGPDAWLAEGERYAGRFANVINGACYWYIFSRFAVMNAVRNVGIARGSISNARGILYRSCYNVRVWIMPVEDADKRK